MNKDFRDTWELYVSSWKAETAQEKLALFEQCLDKSNQYNDPMIKTKGWEELKEYMLNFHQQVPGGHFVTSYFLAHSNKSIARWEMLDGEGTVLGNGISYAEYNEDVKLSSETGFFEIPEV